MNFGEPKGLIIALRKAGIRSSAVLVFRGCNWIYPVNMSIASKIAVLLFLDKGRLRIMSHAQDARGA